MTARFRSLVAIGLFAPLAVISALACGPQDVPPQGTPTTAVQHPAAGTVGTAESATTREAEDETSATQASATGLPGDFTIRAYQGSEVIGGETVDLSSIVGHGRPVVLNFWGGLCPPCRAEMPAFQRTHERFGDSVLFLGVDVGPFVGLGGRQDAKDLIAELGVTYPNGWTFNSRALKDYEIRGIPVTWFFSGDGTVHRVWNGAIPEADLAEITGELAAGS
jgi:thiol-disulfide isomerase/thioredoxin